jgi:hypothetical protein
MKTDLDNPIFKEKYERFFQNIIRLIKFNNNKFTYEINFENNSEILKKELYELIILFWRNMYAFSFNCSNTFTNINEKKYINNFKIPKLSDRFDTGYNLNLIDSYLLIPNIPNKSSTQPKSKRTNAQPKNKIPVETPFDSSQIPVETPSDSSQIPVETPSDSSQITVELATNNLKVTNENMKFLIPIFSAKSLNLSKFDNEKIKKINRIFEKNREHLKPLNKTKMKVFESIYKKSKSKS